MARSSCVENCSNNTKSQPNINFYILPSGKQWCRRWLQEIGRVQQCLKFLHPSCSTAVCKESVLLQFCDKIQSSMHQIFTQMYLTVFIGQSLMDSPTKLFIKKFFLRFRCKGHPIFSHLNLPPDKNPPKQVHAMLHLSPSSKTSPEDT